jgi:hypothetical protein
VESADIVFTVEDETVASAPQSEAEPELEPEVLDAEARKSPVVEDSATAEDISEKIDHADMEAAHEGEDDSESEDEDAVQIEDAEQ